IKSFYNLFFEEKNNIPSNKEKTERFVEGLRRYAAYLEAREAYEKETGAKLSANTNGIVITNDTAQNNLTLSPNSQKPNSGFKPHPSRSDNNVNGNPNGERVKQPIFIDEEIYEDGRATRFDGVD